MCVFSDYFIITDGNVQSMLPWQHVDVGQLRDLGMEDRILTTSKNSVAAQNRFIYYPDHLVRMPGPGGNIFASMATVWREPLFEGAIAGLLSEVNKPRRAEEVTDESIGSFISRRFGSAVADNIVSALYHGIYAGDIYNLSARTILPALWHMESRHSSIMRGMLDQLFGGLKAMSNDDFDALADRSYPLPSAGDVLREVKKSSVFTFKGGLGELAGRLEEKLNNCPNISVYKNTAVNDIKLHFKTEDSKVRASFSFVEPVKCLLVAVCENEIDQKMLAKYIG